MATKSRDPLVGPARSERIVWEYSILSLSMAALVKSAALQNVGRCACKEMLRQHSLHQQKAGLSASWSLHLFAANARFRRQTIRPGTTTGARFRCSLTKVTTLPFI